MHSRMHAAELLLFRASSILCVPFRLRVTKEWLHRATIRYSWVVLAVVPNIGIGSMNVGKSRMNKRAASLDDVTMYVCEFLFVCLGVILNLSFYMFQRSSLPNRLLSLSLSLSIIHCSLRVVVCYFFVPCRHPLTLHFTSVRPRSPDPQTWAARPRPSPNPCCRPPWPGWPRRSGPPRRAPGASCRGRAG